MVVRGVYFVAILSSVSWQSVNLIKAMCFQENRPDRNYVELIKRSDFPFSNVTHAQNLKIYNLNKAPFLSSGSDINTIFSCLYFENTQLALSWELGILSFLSEHTWKSSSSPGQSYIPPSCASIGYLLSHNLFPGAVRTDSELTMFHSVNHFTSLIYCKY